MNYLTKITSGGIAIFLLGFFPARAQEVLVPVEGNPVLSISGKQTIASRKSIAADTLSLPFIDEFSDYSGVPDPSLWSDNYAFINNNYPVYPVTAGVATLDAYNELGAHYSDASYIPYIADRLTSRPIDLSYSVQDNVYLSFYFQPQGLGERPDPEDSLCVEFFAPDEDEWIRVWSTPGDSLRDFRQVFLQVNDSRFLKKGFRFRFLNYASQTANNDFPDFKSNVDHWHIDYIVLEKEVNPSTDIHRDVTFVKPLTGMLKDYESIPWKHLEAAYFTQRTPFIETIIANLDSISRNVSKNLQITNKVSGYTYQSTPAATDITSGDSIHYRFAYDYPFDFTSGDSAIFLLKTILKTDAFDYKKNDTLEIEQNFKNYYAYDDGTAEAGYGLRGRNASVAIQFNAFVQDSLRAVDMYFNRVLDSINLNYYFYLNVWDDNNGVPGELLYSQIGLKPEYTGLNNMVRFHLDSTIAVRDRFYVGWKKTVDEILNIGFDINRNSKQKNFNNLTGAWQTSFYEGSVMLRPVLSQKPLITSNVQYPTEVLPFSMNIFPNPADQFLKVKVNNAEKDPFKLFLMDLTGKKITEFKPESELEIYTGNLENGIYLLILQHQYSGKMMSRKVIINH